MFGLGRTLDLFAVGLRISNFFRAVFAEVAVDSAFLPTFVQLFRGGRKAEANKLFSTVLKLTLLLTTLTTVLAMVTLPMWIEWVTPGFTAKGLIDEAITITRIMFPYLILISVAALLAAVLKAFNHYALPANASIMFNLGVMAGIALYPTFGIAALGYGVLAGGLGQVLIQIPPLLGSEIRRGHGFRFAQSVHVANPGLKRVGRVTPNVLADTTISKAGEVVDITIASMLVEGAIGALNLGRTIFLLPFGLIAQTLNTVLLKELSEGMATQDAKFARRMMIGGINWTIFLLLPTSAAMVILAEPIVRALLQYGRFGTDEVPLVALAVKCYAVGLVGWGLVALTGRFFAARGQMGLGTLTNAVALVVSVGLSLALVKTPFGFAGIALSSGITFTLAAFLRLALLNKSLREEEAAISFADVWPTIFHTTLATSTAAIAAAMSLAAVRNFAAFPGDIGTIVNRVFRLGVPALLRRIRVRGHGVPPRVRADGRDPGAAAARPRPGPRQEARACPRDSPGRPPVARAPRAPPLGPGESRDGRPLQPEQASRPAPRSPEVAGAQRRSQALRASEDASPSGTALRDGGLPQAGAVPLPPARRRLPRARVHAAQRRGFARPPRRSRSAHRRSLPRRPQGSLLGSADRGGRRARRAAAHLSDETRGGSGHQNAQRIWRKDAASRPPRPRSAPSARSPGTIRRSASSGAFTTTRTGRCATRWCAPTKSSIVAASSPTGRSSRPFWMTCS